jgi:hypothetical protein
VKGRGRAKDRGMAKVMEIHTEMEPDVGTAETTEMDRKKVMEIYMKKFGVGPEYEYLKGNGRGAGYQFLRFPNKNGDGRGGDYVLSHIGDSYGPGYIYASDVGDGYHGYIDLPFKDHKTASFP